MMAGVGGGACNRTFVVLSPSHKDMRSHLFLSLVQRQGCRCACGTPEIPFYRRIEVLSDPTTALAPERSQSGPDWALPPARREEELKKSLLIHFPGLKFAYPEPAYVKVFCQPIVQRKLLEWGYTTAATTTCASQDSVQWNFPSHQHTLSAVCELRKQSLSCCYTYELSNPPPCMRDYFSYFLSPRPKLLHSTVSESKQTSCLLSSPYPSPVSPHPFKKSPSTPASPPTTPFLYDPSIQVPFSPPQLPFSPLQFPFSPHAPDHSPLSSKREYLESPSSPQGTKRQRVDHSPIPDKSPTQDRKQCLSCDRYLSAIPFKVHKAANEVGLKLRSTPPRRHGSTPVIIKDASGHVCCKAYAFLSGKLPASEELRNVPSEINLWHHISISSPFRPKFDTQCTYWYLEPHTDEEPDYVDLLFFARNRAVLIGQLSPSLQCVVLHVPHVSRGGEHGSRHGSLVLVSSRSLRIFANPHANVFEMPAHKITNVDSSDSE
ncbi:hypothetical protein Pelo_10801 [Pelomyxa schiedti]|nr:hypothetical protein Pelo_10801 [Pelomyxa schiedti]